MQIKLELVNWMLRHSHSHEMNSGEFWWANISQFKLIFRIEQWSRSESEMIYHRLVQLFLVLQNILKMSKLLFALPLEHLTDIVETKGRQKHSLTVEKKKEEKCKRVSVVLWFVWIQCDRKTWKFANKFSPIGANFAQLKTFNSFHRSAFTRSNTHTSVSLSSIKMRNIQATKIPENPSALLFVVKHILTELGTKVKLKHV